MGNRAKSGECELGNMSVEGFPAADAVSTRDLQTHDQWNVHDPSGVRDTHTQPLSTLDTLRRLRQRDPSSRLRSRQTGQGEMRGLPARAGSGSAAEHPCAIEGWAGGQQRCRDIWGPRRNEDVACVAERFWCAEAPPVE